MNLSIVEGMAGRLCLMTGRIDQGEQHARRALSLARELGQPERLCSALRMLGDILLWRGHVPQAQEFIEDALEVARLLGEGDDLGSALGLAATLHSHRGHFDRARELVHEALALRLREGSLFGLMLAHLQVGQIEMDAGAPATALPHLRTAHALEPRVGSDLAGLHVLGMAAEWAARSGRHDASVLLNAACQSQCRRSGPEGFFEPAQIARLGQSRAALPVERRGRIEASGRDLGLRAALERVGRLLTEPDDDLDGPANLT